MTSKNSFLTSAKENSRRRIVVWIISILVQLAIYPGIMTVYLSRINFWNKEGNYKTAELFEKALQEAVTDALGFKPIATFPILFLAVCIAVQGFSYLHSRKKLDFYQSVPVSARHRFLVIYSNGLFIYLLPAIAASLIAILMGAAQGALTGGAIAEWALAMLADFTYFLIVYNISILAVMLTGNIVITGFAAITLLFIGLAIDQIGQELKRDFFRSLDYAFMRHDNTSCIVMDYLYRMQEFKKMLSLSEITSGVLLLSIKWLAAALVILLIAYFCYKKRPSEAAGQAIAIRPVKPFAKIIISATIGAGVCCLLDDVTYSNIPIIILGMIGATLFISALMEVIYEFDIRAAYKHLISTGIAVTAVIVVFGIHYFDIFGYDSYVPEVDEVESVAVDLGPYQYYWGYDERDGGVIYLDPTFYLRENMFLTDIEAICKLAEKSTQTDPDSIEEYRGFSVLYRLKNGREVSRYLWFDMDDPENAGLLDRIMGTKEYREGHYQIIKDEEGISSLQREFTISYSNGAVTAEIPAAEAQGLQEAWIKDMEKVDYSYVRANRPCGALTWQLKTSYQSWELPVYEDFTNTIDFLKQYNAYYPVALRAEDIASLEITNWHYDDIEAEADASAGADGRPLAQSSAVSYSTAEAVTERFEDPQEIAKIIENLYPSRLDLYWLGNETLDRNYDITISFKANTGYPYGLGYYTYDFLRGQVPDFVAERTACQ
ncbi:MAG: DUF6449 domain-containing protein [Roseburia sp.]|nr:DUF6449 domain-containing protein [Roseburia sp.]MCM1242061.1 DUF6449 domain-containing protein [Roseburia sp.]